MSTSTSRDTLARVREGGQYDLLAQRPVGQDHTGRPSDAGYPGTQLEETHALLADYCTQKVEKDARIKEPRAHLDTMHLDKETQSLKLYRSPEDGWTSGKGGGPDGRDGEATPCV